MQKDALQPTKTIPYIIFRLFAVILVNNVGLLSINMEVETASLSNENVNVNVVHDVTCNAKCKRDISMSEYSLFTFTLFFRRRFQSLVGSIIIFLIRRNAIYAVSDCSRPESILK